MMFAIAIVAALAVVSSADEALSRSGHFKDQPFTSLPSVDECAVFFRRYRSRSFKLYDVDELIVLDTCLGDLYDKNAYDLQEFAEWKELKELYAGTDLSGEKKVCVAELLRNFAAFKKEFGNIMCNNHLLQLFLQFAECQSGRITSEERASDTYLQIVYELVRDRVRSCVAYEIAFIENAKHKTSVKHRISRFANSLKSTSSSLGSDVNRVLYVFGATLNRADIKWLIRGVMVGDERSKSRLLQNLLDYATKENRADSQGYSALVNSMCRSLRASDHEGYTEIATPIIRLNQLLAYNDFRFTSSAQDFDRKLLAAVPEIKSTYLAIQACDILAFTVPIDNEQFTIKFRPQLDGMIAWPVVDIA